jgi:Zn-dependent oligopeptidase
VTREFRRNSHVRNRLAADALDRAARPARFAAIRDEDFEPVIRAAFEAHLAEIEAIAPIPAEPTFENTIEALENPARICRASRRSSSTAPARTPMTRSARSSAPFRRSMRATAPRSR